LRLPKARLLAALKDVAMKSASTKASPNMFQQNPPMVEQCEVKAIENEIPRLLTSVKPHGRVAIQILRSRFKSCDSARATALSITPRMPYVACLMLCCLGVSSQPVAQYLWSQKKSCKHTGARLTWRLLSPQALDVERAKFDPELAAKSNAVVRFLTRAWLHVAEGTKRLTHPHSVIRLERISFRRLVTNCGM
jgi:hypothetical protein